MSDPNIAARAQMYGPATCGCVAVMKTWDVEHLTFVQQAKYGKLRGWARCPHCKGEGVDPRIVLNTAWLPCPGEAEPLKPSMLQCR